MAEAESVFYSHYVREKYLQYSVDYVQKANDVKELKQIIKWFTPSSQPRNRIESIYIEQVQQAARKRVQELKYPFHYVKSKDDWEILCSYVINIVFPLSNVYNFNWSEKYKVKNKQCIF